MSAEVSTRSYYRTVYYISLVQRVLYVIITCTAFGLQNAQIFCVFGLVTQALEFLTSLFTDYVVTHRASKLVPYAVWLNAGVALFAFGGSIVAFIEISTCYFVSNSDFVINRECADGIQGRGVVSYATQQLCHGRSTDYTNIGMCMAAQVAAYLVEVYRAFSVIISLLMLAQTAMNVVTAIILKFFLAHDAGVDAAVESKVTLRMMLKSTDDDSELQAKFVEAIVRVGKTTQEVVDDILESRTTQMLGFRKGK